MLPHHVNEAPEILPGLQKIMYRGALKDEDKTLQELKITNNAKLMLTGSKMEDVMALSTAAEKAQDQEEKEGKGDAFEGSLGDIRYWPSAETESDPNDETEHKKLIEAGPPADAIAPNPDKHEAIPPLGIQGIKNKMNTTIRVSFKTDVDQLCISSASSTQKVCRKGEIMIKM